MLRTPRAARSFPTTSVRHQFSFPLRRPRGDASASTKSPRAPNAAFPRPREITTRPKSSLVVAPSLARARLTGRQQRCRNDMRPMSATSAATMAMTEKSRPMSTKLLSFAGQVPNRIKLSAQSIFLKHHFILVKQDIERMLKQFFASASRACLLTHFMSSLH